MLQQLTSFHFLRPYWLLALLLLPLLLASLRWLGSVAQAWRNVVDAHLLEHLLMRGTAMSSVVPRTWFAASWILALLALAGPAWEQLPQSLYRNRAARVIALELSQTMLAADLKPSRLERARFKINDLLKRSGDGQTALIAYAGEPFVVAPLTEDANTVANLVDALDPSVMPASGNNSADAIDKGVQLIQQAGLSEGDLLLIADSLSDNAQNAAKRAYAAGVRVSVLAMGTRQGAPVSLPQGGFLQDANGNVVLPRLDLVQMQSVAAAGGGSLAVFTTDSSDLERLSNASVAAERNQSGLSEATTVRFRDRGPWLLFVLLPLVACGFRRGWLLMLPLVLFSPIHSAHAFEWKDLWQRSDQQAMAALKAGDAKAAQQLAQDPNLRGSAHYQAGDFAAAAQDFSASLDADAKYNLGTALAKQGQYAEALTAYDQALALKPGMEDALANKQAIEEWLRQQKQNPKDQQKDQDKKADNDNKNDQQSQQGQSQDQNQDQGRQSESPSQDQSSSGNSQSAEQPKTDPSEVAKKDSAEQRQTADAADKREADSAQAKSSEQENAKREYQQDMNQALAQDAEKKTDPYAQDKKAVKPTDAPLTEQQQAMQQWLERVPDDPGGLLRRKFQLEHQRRQGQKNEEGGP